MAHRQYTIGRDELLRLVQRLADSWGEDEDASLLSNTEFLEFMDDLAALVTKYCGGWPGDLTLHRRKIGEIAIKVIIDDQDPRYELWLEHTREH